MPSEQEERHKRILLVFKGLKEPPESQAEHRHVVGSTNPTVG